MAIDEQFEAKICKEMQRLEKELGDKWCLTLIAHSTDDEGMLTEEIYITTRLGPVPSPQLTSYLSDVAKHLKKRHRK